MLKRLWESLHMMWFRFMLWVLNVDPFTYIYMLEGLKKRYIYPLGEPYRRYRKWRAERYLRNWQLTMYNKFNKRT